MQARLASKVLLALGVMDLTMIDLVLAPRLDAKASPSHETAVLHFAPAALRSRVEPDVAEVAPIPATESFVQRIGEEPSDAMPDIEFEFGTDRILRRGALRELRQIASTLRGSPDKRLVVRGHADRIGTHQSNFELGLARARAVVAFLIVFGAPKGQITVESAGDREPLDASNTPAAWARNRRVQVQFR